LNGQHFRKAKEFIDAEDWKSLAASDVMASSHHCMSCGFHMHSPLFCGECFEEWHADIGASFITTMLPPHGQAKFADYANSLGKTGLFICQRCIYDINMEISSAPTGSTVPCTNDISVSSLSNEDCAGNDVEVLVAATQKKKTPSANKKKAP
jgi:hypothetical protein